jgi:hypothetical protein
VPDLCALCTKSRPRLSVFNIEDAGNPIQFSIPSSNQHFDLSSSFVYVKLKILKSDSKPLESTNIVSGCQNMFAGLFNSCESMLGSTVVSKSANLYPYRAHILDTLSRGSSYISDQLYCQLYYPDTKKDIFIVEQNSGFKKRVDICKQSFELIGNISKSVFQSTRYIPGIELRVRLRKSDSAFCLTGETSSIDLFPYLVEFDDCVFYLKKFTLHPYVL